MMGGSMRRLSMIAAGVLGLTVVACGQTVAPSSGSPAPVNCVHRAAQGPAKRISIGRADNGKTLCVNAGTGMFVFLHGTQSRRWAPLHSSSGALVVKPSGMMSLAVGVTGGYFVAMRAGTATLTSVRSPCHVGGSGCPAGTSFKVTVLVSAH